MFAEQFNFTVPNDFTALTLYIVDANTVSRDQRLGHLIFTRDQLSGGHEFPVEKWYDLQSVTPDSQVQVSTVHSLYMYMYMYMCGMIDVVCM